MYPPELQWPVVFRGFFLYKCSLPDQTMCITCKWTFLLAVPFQKPTIYSLYCNRRPGLAKWQHAFSFSALATEAERHGDSSGTSDKRHHITISNTSSFHSSAFRFKSNAAVKQYTFHVYTLYIQQINWNVTSASLTKPLEVNRPLHPEHHPVSFLPC